MGRKLLNPHNNYISSSVSCGREIIPRKDIHVPERATQLLVRFTCCEIDERTCDVQAHISAALSIPTRTNKEETSKPKKLNIPLPHAEGRVLLVVITLQMRLDRGNSSSEDFLTADRKYYAGEVLQVGYVRDGVWITCEKAKPTHPTQGAYLDDQSNIQWEE
ncbi:hypothetical protein [Olivibacter sitiensis]|uniref:hypothetical protein n=1 Tax=Olivibacter sitiensis TaxID=376470 RepID=UPI000482B99E|nr:hypothetical protein [Olivibacter sitiensis]